MVICFFFFGQVKFSLDKHIIAIYLSWASINIYYFHTPVEWAWFVATLNQQLKS